MKLINELSISWHKWRMERTYGYDRDLCRYHMNQMMRLVKGRNK